jgi:hypothetical protein
MIAAANPAIAGGVSFYIGIRQAADALCTAERVVT